MPSLIDLVESARSVLSKPACKRNLGWSRLVCTSGIAFSVLLGHDDGTRRIRRDLPGHCGISSEIRGRREVSGHVRRPTWPQWGKDLTG